MHNWLMGISALLIALIAGTPGNANAQAYTPKGPIEAKYIAPGPWAVSEMRTPDACDYKGDACTIYFPTNLGSNPLKGLTDGFVHPVIAWANGTGVPTAEYAAILRHWASWGFVVVSTDDMSTGDGGSVTNATEYLIALNSNPSSIFYHKIDPSRIGVSGHSQGGAAAMGLFVRRPDLFKTAVPYNATTAALSLVLGWTSPIQLLGVTQGSIFYVGGALDPVADPTSNLAFYLSTSNADKALGVLTDASHDSIVHVATCSAADCLAGRGYPTAWMMWKLQDAADGQDAFRAGSGEFSQFNLQWLLAMSNVK